MAEAGGLNVEIATTLNERLLDRRVHRSQLEKLIEILEALVLAVIAIATAWSGYEAARWNGQQAELYGTSVKLTTRAQGLSLVSGQEQLYDTVTFNAWLAAKSSGLQRAAQLLERRFRDEYRVAFVRWMEMDPFKNASAPAGPIFMPEYRNAKAEEAKRVSSTASELFERGTLARNTADRYVRVTVFLATVLLLTATSQRFELKSVRTALSIMAAALLIAGITKILMLPHL
jgi:hypothetical protein